MVQQRAHAIEAHGAEQLFVIEVALGTFVYRMPLVRDVAEAVVDGHLSLSVVRY